MWQVGLLCARWTAAILLPLHRWGCWRRWACVCADPAVVALAGVAAPARSGWSSSAYGWHGAARRGLALALTVSGAAVCAAAGFQWSGSLAARWPQARTRGSSNAGRERGGGGGASASFLCCWRFMSTTVFLYITNWYMSIIAKPRGWCCCRRRCCWLVGQGASRAIGWLALLLVSRRAGGCAVGAPQAVRGEI